MAPLEIPRGAPFTSSNTAWGSPELCPSNTALRNIITFLSAARYKPQSGPVRGGTRWAANDPFLASRSDTFGVSFRNPEAQRNIVLVGPCGSNIGGKRMWENVMGEKTMPISCLACLQPFAPKLSYAKFPSQSPSKGFLTCLCLSPKG